MDVLDETNRIVATSRAPSDGYLHHRPRGSCWERKSFVPYRRLPIRHIIRQKTRRARWGRQHQRRMTREPSVIPLDAGRMLLDVSFASLQPPRAKATHIFSHASSTEGTEDDHCDHLSLSADPRVVQYVESEPQSITCPTHHRGISSELAAGFPATPTCPPAGIMAYRPHCGHQRPPHIRRSRTVCGRIWTGASPGLTALSRPRLDSATRGYAVLCAYGVGDSWGNYSTA